MRTHGHILRLREPMDISPAVGSSKAVFLSTAPRVSLDAVIGKWIQGVKGERFIFAEPVIVTVELLRDYSHPMEPLA